MPRALVATWSAVSPADRDGAIARWRDRRDRLAATGCHFWVYESHSHPGQFLEFTEARDEGLLHTCCAQAGITPPVSSVLHEVELL